jgi:hypothetical protein
LCLPTSRRSLSLVLQELLMLLLVVVVLVLLRVLLRRFA